MEEYLEHHGILGMRWGVRRSRKQLAAGRSSSHNSIKAENKRERLRRASAMKNRRLLSDDEIRSRMARMKLEREFKELTDNDLSPGKKATQKVMSENGKKVAGIFVSLAATAASKAAIDYASKKGKAYAEKMAKKKTAEKAAGTAAKVVSAVV